MKKIVTIARREYQAMVSTKAFLIGLAIMPVLMTGGVLVPRLLSGIEQAEDRRIVVVDHTGQLFQPLQMIAQQRNLMLQTNSDDDEEPSAPDGQSFLISGPKLSEKEKSARSVMGLEDIHRYVMEEMPAAGFDDQQRLELSMQIRAGDLYAFLEIPEDVLKISNPLASGDLSRLSLTLPEIEYVAEDAAISDTRRWLQSTLNQVIRGTRLAATVTPQNLPLVMIELERTAAVTGTGLYSMQSDGSISSDEKPSEIAATLVPLAIMMLMFMIIMMSAQPMLESVLEEKTLRISEVLLGSANAQQLMMGKLLGNVAGSLTVFGVYALGGLCFASYQGYASLIPWHVLPWFLVYQVLAVLMFSSVFMAIAACVSQLREAQSLLLPVWMVIMLPLMVWIKAVREPNSLMATGLSFFPPSTPLMMTLRLSTGATIPLWQIMLSFVILVGGTVLGVTAAARIYRIGILRQGKTPRLSEMISWLVKAPN